MRIVNARLADGHVVDLAIDGGSIVGVDAHRGSEPVPDDPDVVDLGGRLLLPAPAEPHAHVDKALTADMAPNRTGDLSGAIDAWITAAEAGAFTHDDMVGRIGAALDRLLLNGVTAVRSHINCGDRPEAPHVEAAREAAEPYRDAMHIEFVALPHAPLVGRAGAPHRRALQAALEAGVDLVGGCPHLERDGLGSIGVTLDAAGDAGLPVDLHVDETLDPTFLTLRALAREVTSRGFDRAVTASHCVSLGIQPPATQSAVADEVAAAGIAVVTLPQTNLFLQGRDHATSPPRGLTAIGALRAAGVTVAAGGDNVQDPFNLVGRSDPLETAALVVMAGHVLPDDAYAMVANDARRAMGLAPVRFRVGDPADFMAVAASSVRSAIADAPADRMTFRAGRLVATTSTTRTIHR